MSKRKKKYSEIFLLKKMLQEKKIHYWMHNLEDGYQIEIPLTDTQWISIIEHQFSYGSMFDLLELLDERGVQGFLTAEQTMHIIERIHARESPGKQSSK